MSTSTFPHTCKIRGAWHFGTTFVDIHNNLEIENFLKTTKLGRPIGIFKKNGLFLRRWKVGRLETSQKNVSWFPEEILSREHLPEKLPKADIVVSHTIPPPDC